MTIEEARMVAAICNTADSGCHVCVEVIYKHLQRHLPEIPWRYRGMDFDWDSFDENDYRHGIYLYVDPEIEYEYDETGNVLLPKKERTK